MGYEKSAQLYDLFDRKDNTEFFLKFALKAGEFLDIGAGTGRIAIPAAKRGVRVTAVEPSPAMRREFKKKLVDNPELSQIVTIIDGDARSFDVDKSFPLAIMSGVFDHLIDDSVRHQSLENIANHLQTGGKLVLDVATGLMKSRELHPAGEGRDDRLIYRRFVASKKLSQTLIEVTLVIETFEGSRLINRTEEVSHVGAISSDELKRLLSETGFEVTNEYGGYDFSEPSAKSEYMIIRAVKR